jgi:NTP pyrophosphatase (non-canonical NTP hydrolase)
MNAHEYIHAALKTEMNFSQYEMISVRLKDLNAARLLHATMGLVTEAGELMDTLKKYLIYGKPIDWTNVAEEIGDSQWYTALAVDVTGEVVKGVTWEGILDQNIAKLKARYPNKFSEESALNRDLEKEREVLSDSEWLRDGGMW